MKKLEIKNVSKSFGEKEVLKNISIELGHGEIVSLLGVSGGGKTTLFNIISGLIEPDEGTVILDGTDITNAPGHI
ncbi:MAG: ABC transporter ATP-binding protein, partial [Oscillospiraceae bacterium]|nr:ABC transporter ATP-binding protein [Oscillospiraceae bacterium]